MTFSDLRAELDQLPKPSQLMFVEPKIIQPKSLPGCDIGSTIPLYNGQHLRTQDIHMSYSFQIQLRLTLNRVHASLYSRNLGIHLQLQKFASYTNQLQNFPSKASGRPRSGPLQCGQTRTRAISSTNFEAFVKCFDRRVSMAGAMAIHLRKNFCLPGSVQNTMVASTSSFGHTSTMP
jgi:hypothetical protein